MVEVSLLGKQWSEGKVLQAQETACANTQGKENVSKMQVVESC